ncbi:MAG: Co2+/Mg2+ efflux protein ApaG [Xanthomonadales bacterium]|nr:Co2+/Mg2+ efflux protein ApaG [Xanthomonadales bacterium]ODU93720.1 MAG: Co2+/Mg2+ efflux protein ApaG [Rhodanobacter sp. SCN 66-43]OJY83315.1 MAG: Co2+/Mg2+ efflux protein ApaG [Xanthomonadales bacterium 66-474]
MSPRQTSTDKTSEPREPEPYSVEIEVEARYVAEQSKPEADRYVFAYVITMRNLGVMPARLQTRHWVITDANGKVEEVRGEGVVGEQPRLQPGEQYSYASGAVLDTQVGTMRGAYLFHADDGTDFEVPIPEFVLSVPRTLH